jgi:hypothetical protein
MSVHTAGPWARVAMPDRSWQIETHHDGCRVAQVPDVTSQDEANARLIAAAPDLLHAAQLALRYLTLEGDALFSCRTADLERALREAITRAGGSIE